MREKKVLILDYSTDKSETAAIMRWIPERVDADFRYVNTSSSLPDDLADRGYTHIIHSGSACSINRKYPFSRRAEGFVREMRDRGTAQFGICFGHQLLCLALQGETAVRQSPLGLEAGWEDIIFTEEGKALFSVGEKERVWQSHFDEVTEIPRGSVIVASNSHSAVQAFYNREQKLLGTQFHPEFDRGWGDRLFQRERSMLEENGFSVDGILRRGPSIDTGTVFFNFFLNI